MFPFFSYSINRALAKTCLTVSMAAISAASLIVYLAVRNDNVLINSAFNWNLLFVQAAIVFIVFVTARAVLRENRDAIPLLIDVVVGVGFGTHDIIYSAMNLKPFAWLQGIGFFSMNLSPFITLTLRFSRLYKELERYSKDIEEKTQQLSIYISRIEKTADSVSSITSEIDTDAGIAASAASKLASEAERIGVNADKQAQAASDSEEAVRRLGDSLGLVRAGAGRDRGGLRGADKPSFHERCHRSRPRRRRRPGLRGDRRQDQGTGGRFRRADGTHPGIDTGHREAYRERGCGER